MWFVHEALTDRPSQRIQATAKRPHLGVLGLYRLGQRLHAGNKMADDLIHTVDAVARCDTTGTPDAPSGAPTPSRGSRGCGRGSALARLHS
jgi:hypothetical protein